MGWQSMGTCVNMIDHVWTTSGEHVKHVLYAQGTCMCNNMTLVFPLETLATLRCHDSISYAERTRVLHARASINDQKINL